MSFISALYVRVIQFSVVYEYGVDFWRVGDRRMKSVREEGSKEMNRVETIDQIFFHLGPIVDSNDRPVSADQSRRLIHDDTILQ